MERVPEGRVRFHRPRPHHDARGLALPRPRAKLGSVVPIRTLRSPTMPSLSRKLAAWVAGLQFSDLPPNVVDRAKGVTLHGLGSSLLGAGMPAGKRALQLMQEEDAGGNGVATVLVSGVKLTR